ncbi:selenocysteine-specific translation elongation factor [Haloimpatiens sp. FM7315]|uniref:selenocysteine-specific translation elongation factor n=1 Tax=Haloimpatiens sp. FM7315 TaxID=3298609 RepID=UPI0039778111
MKHLIIGTAGHIDHGKTSLIKALTGRETDNLREEKERGISINLGFTFFDLPSGKRAGIIDVPGHERFIKNMLAGISSIDIVILVIAADEGIMPQTREHFEILQLLNVKKGIIALTKCDLVDKEWIGLVGEDIRNEFKGTFLESAPMYPVSSKTKEGFKELIEAVDKATEEVGAKDIEGHFRLPVDRVFSVSGFGTVVTGTVISGSVKVGEEVEIYPSKIKTKVRGLQVHEKSVDLSEAGQRCAINLSNIKVSDIERGNVISKENAMEPSFMVDTKFYYLKSADRPLENRQRVRLYHGTEEILCRTVILDKDAINPGEEAYVQLRLEKPLSSQRNDRFVIRSYSPMHTIGGGSIIEPVAIKAKRFDEKYLKDLKLKESGHVGGILEATVKKLSPNFPDIKSILKALGKNENSIQEELLDLIKQGKIIKLVALDNELYVHFEYIKRNMDRLEEILEEYHSKYPLRQGIAKEEIKEKLFGKSLKQKTYDEILSIMVSYGIIDIHSKLISKHGFEVKFNEEQENIKNYIINEYDKSRFAPPKFKDLLDKQKDKENFKMVFEALILGGDLVKTDEECIFSLKCYEEAREKIVSYMKENGEITPKEARDILDTSRKYVVSILEHFDGEKITRRLENKRVLYKA